MTRPCIVVKQIRACDVNVGDVIARDRGALRSWGRVKDIGPSHAIDYPDLIWIDAEGLEAFNHKAYDLVCVQVETSEKT